MPSNTLEDLRSKLFDTIDALKKDDNPMSIERAKAIAEVAGKVIDSAKVEVEYLKVTDQNDARLPVMGEHAEQKPSLPGSTVHRIK